MKSSKHELRIWLLALGYFSLYIPYSTLTKSLSKGLLPGAKATISGFELLPTVALFTTVTLLIYISLMGGWESLHRKQFLGFSIPIPRKATLISGLATATIIATTTLNYTFTGFSILFALLLMRGGVLIMAPIVDTLFHRKVQFNSWIALSLSFLGIIIAFTDVDNYQITLIAALNVSAYLIGYVFRLQFMTKLAKSEEKIVNRRYFLEETMVAAIALTLIPAILALIGQGEIMQQLRSGYTNFITSNLVLPAVGIGFLYSCLYFFGSHIYLDKRENTFAIPLNRCSSLMSGLVATYGLTWFLGQKPPSNSQLIAVGIIFTALIVLGFSAIQAKLQKQTQEIQTMGQQVYLFICGGNTSRSPMAQAFCNHEIMRFLNLSHHELETAPVVAWSAGINTNIGTSMTEEAYHTLNHYSVTPHAHESSNVCANKVEKATMIFCMTKDHHNVLLEKFPHAAPKTHLLDPNGDIPNPSGSNLETYLTIGEQIQSLVRKRLHELGHEIN